MVVGPYTPPESGDGCPYVVVMQLPINRFKRYFKTNISPITKTKKQKIILAKHMLTVTIWH